MHRLIAIKQRRSNASPGAAGSEVASFPSGLKLLHQADESVVDIVFVHGLTGDRERTWRHEEEQLSWPQTLLPQKIPNCRVLTFGYDAYVTDLKGLDRMVSTSTVFDHGSSLVLSLGNLRADDGTSKRPLIFVTHSLGGIVCKDGLCYAAKMEGDPRLQTLFSSTCGVLFMGTPHQGSSLAPWAKGIAGTLGFVKQTNRRLLKVLRSDSELLSRVNEAFLTMIEQRKANSSPLFPIRISCFFEELPLPVVGLVVPRASAVLPGHIIVGIRGNHRDMARFRQLDDGGFLSVVGELKECIRSANLQRRTMEVPVPIPSPALAEVRASPTPFIMPFSRNDGFVGRSETIRQLKTILRHLPGNASAYPIHQRAALYGLGGIGKTQIAIEYAWTLHQEAPDMAIFWIRASSVDQFVQSYTQIAQQFQIPGVGDLSRGKLELVRDWLVSYPSRWLLIIDNADDASVLFGDDKPPSAVDVSRSEDQAAESAPLPTSSGRADPLRQYIPESPNGTILLTSRNKQVASSFLRGRFNGLINVQGFSDEDASRFIQDMIGDQNEDDVRALATELERLPLALSQAAAYIQTRCITIPMYLDLLRESLVELFDQPFEDHGRDGTDIPNAVAATWALSFNQIQSQSPLAGTLLSVMACLERDVIPRDFLYTCLENFASHSTSTSSHVQIEDALGLLKAYSLTAEACGGKFLTVHRLVHLVARSWLQREGGHAPVGELVLASIWKGFPRDFDFSCLIYHNSVSELHRTVASTKSPVTSKCLRVVAQVNVTWTLIRLWLDAGDGDRALVEDALKLFQKSTTSLEALEAASFGLRFTESLLALLNNDISWEAAEELFSGLETEATVTHSADSMDTKWAQWGRSLVQRRCPSVCKIRAIAAKEILEKTISIKEISRAIAEGRHEESAAETDEASALNVAKAKVMFEILSRAEENMVAELEAADRLHEEAELKLEALRAITVICKDLKGRFDAMPLEERLAKYGAATWTQYWVGMEVENRLARREKSSVGDVDRPEPRGKRKKGTP